tara:strand:- start:106216 stop:112590 length:6375 start_codon:yes stop_codon:yes gene_type:complete
LADQFNIEAKLKITGVDVKGDLDAGTLKFKVDTSALKKLVSDAGVAAKKVKARFDNIKLNKVKVELNKNSLRAAESQIRNAVQNAVKKTRLDIQANVAGGTKTDPFKAQRQAAGKSATSLSTLHELTKQVNGGLRSLVRTLGSMGSGGAGPAGGAKGSLPFPAGARTVNVGDIPGGGGGGRPPRPAGPGASPGGAGRGGGGVGDAAKSMEKLTDSTKMANSEMDQLEQLSFEVGKKAAAFRGVAIAINTIVNASAAAAKFIIEFNDSLIEVNKILQLSDQSLQALGNDLFGLSAKTGVAVDQTVSIAEAFARAGISGRGYGTVVDLTNRALTGLQGTTLDATQASELFIQIIQQVEGGVRGLNKELITTTKLFDVLGKAEDITASKATDVQQAFKRSAASIFATGASIEEATAIISVLQERTQRGGDVIGTALKTLASRISSSSSEATKALNDIGVETIDAQGNLRNLFDVLQDTAVQFKNLTEAERADVGVKAAGIRQVEVFRAAVQDFNRTQEVTDQLINATGDSTRKQAAEQKKLANTISRLQIGFQQLVKTASEGLLGQAFVKAIEGAEFLVTGIGKLDKALGGVVTTLAGVTFVALGLKVLIPLVKGIFRAFQLFAGLQREVTVGMGGLQKASAGVGTTINGQINTAMQRTATSTATATTQMQGLSAATLFAASQAERLAKANAAAALASPGGQAGVANRAKGNVGNQGVDIIASGRSGAGGAAKKVGKFGRAASSAAKHIGVLSIGASIAGGALQLFGENLKKEGNSKAGAAADIAGGALAGAGTGALIGSFIPVIGTAIGAAVGGAIGAFGPLSEALGGVGSAADELAERYLKLGIIQTENGEITSAVAAKLDKALKNLKSFSKVELGLEEGRLNDLFDPEGSAGRRAKTEGARTSAVKGLKGGFDSGASAQAQNTQVFKALSRVLQQSTGQKGLDLSAPELLQKSSPVLEQVGEATLQQIEKEATKLADTFGVSTQEVRDVFDQEISKIRSKPLTRRAIQDAQRGIENSTTAFVDGLDVLLPAGEQISKAAREQADKFKKAIEQIALGQGGKETQEAIDEVLANLLKGRAFKGEGGADIVGSAGASELKSLQKSAESLASQRRNVGVSSVGSALPEILKRLGPLLSGGVASTQAQQQQDNLIRGQERLTDAFETRTEFPVESFGRFLNGSVNELGNTMRDFISDFGRQISKLNEAQIKSITPQKELAEAMAMNSLEMVKSTQRRVELEKSDALLKSKQEFSKIAGRGELQFKGIAGQEDNKSTVGDALQKLFQVLVDANRKIASEGISDPDKQRSVLSDARSSVDLTNVNDKQIKTVTDSVLDLTKGFVKLDTEALQAISKSNAAAVTALKQRMSEEQRLLGVSQRQREAAAMNARAITEELTGIRRLVAVRQIESQLTESNVSAQKGRLSGMDEEIAKLNAVKQTEQNRAGVLDQLQILEESRASESIKLEEMLAKLRISAIRNTLQIASEAVSVSKSVADQERKRIGSLAQINSLLSVDQKQMSKFNAELDTLGAQFRNSQAQLAAEAASVNATISDQAERESRLGDIKKRGAALALDQAKAEAQVIQKRREAVKQVSEDLLGNQGEQVDAQRAVMEATRGVSAAFESYLQAVDGAVMATTRYNLGLSLAAVETTKITGGFSGMREEIGAVQDAFRSAESLARQLGASEQTLVEIRRDSINQQLALFSNLLQEQSQMARSFFTSSAQDQSDLFLGVGEASNVADLLGGSFENFKKLGEGAINDLGAQLLALPQETRQRVISSLETLKGVGGEVGGFSADELLTAIETASLGVSGEGLEVDPLFQVQERIASLQEEQARLATDQLLASQEQVVNSKEQLAQAEGARDLAEIQLERVQEEGEKLRGKMGELQGQLNTTLLQQEQTQRQGFNAVTSAVDRATDAVVNRLPDAFSVKVAEAFREVMQSGGVPIQTAGAALSESNDTPRSRGREVADSQRAAGRNRAVTAQQFAQSGPSTVNQSVASTSAPAGGGTTTEDSNAAIRRLEEVVTQLRDLNSTSETNLAVTQQILDSSGNSLGTASATVDGGQSEININVAGQTTVTVTGFEAGVARLATTLAETLGGFVSADEARRIADEVLENIRTELLRRGIITPTTL